jgi:hypothetical protein
MSFRKLGVIVAGALALAAETVVAQPVNACPTGQAIQSSDPSGRKVTCVPIPDVGALQGQISAEAASRAGMDATLLGAIDDLRESVGLETSIVGLYAFSGTTSCINSTFGFNDDLTAKASIDPTRPAVVNQFSGVTTGFRTFNADGTGTAEFHNQTTSFPGAFYTSSGFTGVTATVTPNQPFGRAAA